jgi:hypothetical protein
MPSTHFIGGRSSFVDNSRRPWPSRRRHCDPLTFVDRLGGSSATLMVEMTLYAICLLAHWIATVQGDSFESFVLLLSLPRCSAFCLLWQQDSAVHLPANWISAPALARQFVVLEG